MLYKQDVMYYYFPSITIEKERLNVTFYRNRGQKAVKFTREELQKYWHAKSTARSIEFQKLIKENNRSKADLAGYPGVSSHLGDDFNAGAEIVENFCYYM